jgi:hypothetical protein
MIVKKKCIRDFKKKFAFYYMKSYNLHFLFEKYVIKKIFIYDL